METGPSKIKITRSPTIAAFCWRQSATLRRFPVLLLYFLLADSYRQSRVLSTQHSETQRPMACLLASLLLPRGHLHLAVEPGVCMPYSAQLEEKKCFCRKEPRGRDVGGEQKKRHSLHHCRCDTERWRGIMRRKPFKPYAEIVRPPTAKIRQPDPIGSDFGHHHRHMPTGMSCWSRFAMQCSSPPPRHQL